MLCALFSLTKEFENQRYLTLPFLKWLYVFFTKFEWKHLLNHSNSSTVHVNILIYIFFLRDVNIFSLKEKRL